MLFPAHLLYRLSACVSLVMSNEQRVKSENDSYSSPMVSNAL